MAYSVPATFVFPGGNQSEADRRKPVRRNAGHCQREHGYLQTTDAHFERAVAEPVAPKSCKMAQTGKPENKQTPTKPSVLRGLASAFATNSYPVGT